MSERAEFLDGRVVLHAGDCLDVLRALPDASVDSIVTDPPYELASIRKRFGAAGAKAAKAKAGGTGAYARAAKGFMGKQWDTGERAFAAEFWAEALRVLKPGGHLAAFGGTRTYHRLACAIEDAGFEIRDQLAWAYGAGFPKSHDVAKAIDRVGGMSPVEQARLLRHKREAANLSRADVAAAVGCTEASVRDWEEGRARAVGRAVEHITPSAEYREKLAGLLGYSADERRRIGAAQDRRGDGTVYALGHSGETTTGGHTEEAARWQGWGTALKPAWEPICLARKPIIGTVAANVLAHGTGALNVDACRVEGEAWSRPGSNAVGGVYGDFANDAARTNAAGRWPANIVHDGSDEVVAAFPVSAGQLPFKGADRVSVKKTINVYGEFVGRREIPPVRGDSGSAARFFYSAKADAADRLGSKHPTVKPVDLMQWLCRLITPPGGTVLDPFAGTGTTGEAAWREGFRAVLIEREAEYRTDIARRLELADRPAKRAAVAKTRNAIAQDAGPLFGGLEAANEQGGGAGSTAASPATEGPDHRADGAKAVA